MIPPFLLLQKKIISIVKSMHGEHSLSVYVIKL